MPPFRRTTSAIAKQAPRWLWWALGLSVVVALAGLWWQAHRAASPPPSQWQGFREAYRGRAALLPWVQEALAHPSGAKLAYAMLVVARCDHLAAGSTPTGVAGLGAEQERWARACRGLMGQADVRTALRAAAAKLPEPTLAVDGFEVPGALSGLAAVRAAWAWGDGDLFIEALALLQPGDVTPVWPALAQAQQPRQELGFWQLAAWVETCERLGCDDAYYRWRLCAELRRCEAPSGVAQVSAIALEQVDEATWARLRQSVRLLMAV